MHNQKNLDAYDNLFAVFNHIYPLSDELKSAITRHAKVVHVARKTVLLEAGSPSDKIYFIIKGAARVYYLDEDGVETTSWFLFENELLISVYSFFKGVPSFEYLETIEDCKFIVLKRETLDWLYEHFLEFNFIGRKLTESYYVRNEEQANSLRKLDAKARYKELLHTSPQLINRVPLGYIASYLGISQETLSRIRKKI